VTGFDAPRVQVVAPVVVEGDPVNLDLGDTGIGSSSVRWSVDGSSIAVLDELIEYGDRRTIDAPAHARRSDASVTKIQVDGITLHDHRCHHLHAWCIEPGHT